jgi:hypothetical protein
VLAAGTSAVLEQAGRPAEPAMLAAPVPQGPAARELVQSLSTSLWQPLAAADAVYETDGTGAPRLRSGLWLRPRDALALAVALQAGGQVGGNRLLSAASGARVLESLEDGVAPRGAEPFGARQVRLLRDDAGTRLYFFPVQELVILLVGADEARLADETELAHQVLRGIVDRAPTVAPAPATSDLVPRH